MGRAPLTVVVLLGRGGDGTVALTHLKGELREGDQVVLLGPADAPPSTPDTFAFQQLADQAAAWDARAAAARSADHELVLLLCGDTALAPGTVDRLVTAMLTHPELDACSPGGGHAGNGARSRTRPAAQLPPSCILVRRSAPDVVLEGRGQRGRLATVAGARATHAGGGACAVGVDPAAPLLTLAMIVKNEEAHVADAIRSARCLVDDVVVYDTGSDDSTREVALREGARVVEGYWDDDFAAARNRAMEHVTTPWVLFLDGDEELEVDSPGELRGRLLTCEEDALWVTCRNLADRGGVDLEFLLARVLRRGRTRWDQPLHEQVVHHLTGRVVDVVLAHSQGLRLRHVGYRSDVMTSKGKQTRNDLVARQELAAAEDSEDVGRLFTALVNAARSAADTAEGRAEALSWCERAWLLPRTAAATPFMLARVTHTAAIRALHDEDAEQANRWRDRFLHATGNDPEAQLLAARIALLQGDALAAIQLTEALPASYTTIYGTTARRADVLPWVLRMRLSEGLDARGTVAELVAHDVAEVDLLPLLAAFDGLLLEFAKALSKHPAPAMLRSVCGQAIAHPEGSRILRALRTAMPHDATPMVAASRLSPTAMTIDDAVYWSFALRSSGHSDLCPLVKIRESDRPSRAAVACAILADACADEESWQQLERRLEAVPDQETDTAADLIRTYAPRIGEMLVPV